MVTNIDTLTDKIYQEGVNKAQNEADEIIRNAKVRAEEILEEAQKISDQIIEKANKQASELKQNAVSDLKLAGNKAIIALKQEIRKLLHQLILHEPVEDLFSDKDFLKDLILAVAKNYSQESMTVILPKKNKDKLEKALAGSIMKELDGMNVRFSNSINGGFQIERQDMDYVITFTDDDFIEFLKHFLNSKTGEILFNNGK